MAIIDLLKQLLTKVDRMERSIAEVQGSVERQESNTAKLSTTVDDIKSQLLPINYIGEQPSVHLESSPLPAVTAAAALLDISTGMLDAGPIVLDDDDDDDQKAATKLVSSGPPLVAAGKVRPLLFCTHTHLLCCWITEHLQHTSRTPPMLVSLMMPDHRTPQNTSRTPI